MVKNRCFQWVKQLTGGVGSKDTYGSLLDDRYKPHSVNALYKLLDKSIPICGLLNSG